MCARDSSCLRGIWSYKDGGLEEMIDELSGARVMYVFLKVIDPNTKLPKNVLVNWVSRGEGREGGRKKGL